MDTELKVEQFVSKQMKKTTAMMQRMKTGSCQSFPPDTQVRGSAATVRSQRQLYPAVI